MYELKVSNGFMIGHDHYGNRIAKSPDGSYLRFVTAINGTLQCRVEVKISNEWMNFVGPFTECHELFDGLIYGS
jgi:hypothetical protein